MKFKSTAIALAVAGTVATPMAAQADLYASARIGIQNVDTGDVSDVEVRGFASRFGMRGETDLGNGMTGFGRYEFGVSTEGTVSEASVEATFPDDTFDPPDADTDPDEVSVGFDTGGLNVTRRHAYVGLKGDFGSVTLGQTYHTFYNHVVGPNDNPWWGSGYYMVEYRGRTDNAITYAGGTDMFTFGVTGYFERDSEEEAPDQLEIGASFGIGDMTLGIAAQTTADDTSHGSAGNDEDIIGLALTGISLGEASLGFGYQQQDDDSSILADIGIGNAYVHIEMLQADEASAASDSGDDEDKTAITLGYTQSLGRKTTAWYEIVSTDADTGDSDDDLTAIRAVLKYDIE